MGKRSLYIIALLTLAAAGCGPGGQRNALGPTELPVERERRYFHRAVVSGKDAEMAVELVKESAYQGGPRTTEEWLNEEVDTTSPQVLFPRWEAVRVAPDEYQVRYTWTLVSDSVAVGRHGYTWSVNAVLGLVGTIQELEPEELVGDDRQLRGARSVHEPQPYSLE